MTRFVAVSDTHYAFDASLIPDGDVLLHAGDLMYRGTPDEWNERVESLAALPHKHKIFVPGNHDFYLEHYEGVARAELRRAGVKLIGTSNPDITINNIKILGLPWVTGLQGWAYNREEAWVEKYLERYFQHSYPSPQIVVSHAPPFNILDAIRPQQTAHRDQEHVGCLAYNKFIYGPNQHFMPRYWISGHIHESYGEENIGNTTFLNVAMCDRKYDQTNPAKVFDL